MKKSCKNCFYSGWFNPKNKYASCDCPQNENSFRIKHLGQNEFVVNCENWEEEIDCEHFIPNVNDEDSIEEDTYSITDLSIKCPHCNKEYTGKICPYCEEPYVYEQKKDNMLFELVYNAEHPNYKLLNKDINNLLAKLYKEKITGRTMEQVWVGID